MRNFFIKLLLVIYYIPVIGFLLGAFSGLSSGYLNDFDNERDITDSPSWAISQVVGIPLAIMIPIILIDILK